ncbi:uncharacterized protein LOC128890357 [Hylaeus anthracinus]|uniref:uncharacterized protein LOC128881226 n=1 Tax=Hylaeus volcanicus TaxID=313075 RepID=UPI0023B78D26|nr:uncharacterized protein LOC128881226 [Hylaeus volcanicus]XP_053988028.1 uncharacterized protein LOC128881226 [Hylaeus volcanicus]XP_053988038.1 uncharacterized protein LOC128881226 [Hylaeus volcanicus]XP_054004756.1 uncharacterized protein LOC128890357 [Hylaeus anthracinus]XP_054004757.1 uncharacterized protein LOC128890357 [Hylaeus anthracinus]XP_054004758.1 uncharacterized protein LOC128890357 [Hylaeus anthracinus]
MTCEEKTPLMPTIDCLHRSYFLNDERLMCLDCSTVTEDGVPIRKLFISNLAERTTYKDLTKLFSKYGYVERCYLRRNGVKSNYGFVTFDSVESAVRARRRDIVLHNRYLRIVPADPWHQPDSIENQYYNKDWQKSEKNQSVEQCTQDFVQSDVTDTSIQILNDDCLTHIFLQLPIVDRIRIERVCKRWRAISQESWRNVKKLDVSYGAQWCSWTMKPIITTNILRKILLRCGRFLHEIDLNQVAGSLDQSTVTIVAKLCPNLQRINLNGLGVSAAGINSLTNNCHNITKFSLGYTSSICDRDLQKLFQVNPKLRYFEVHYSNICGKCLLHLPLKAIEEIVLRHCCCLQENYLSQAVEQLHNLKSLTICDCFYITDKVINAIGTYCTSLKTLELCNISFVIQPNAMLPITQLTNLEVLKINNNKVVTDELICNLASKCQKITYIDVTECHCVTNIGVTAIATLPNLETLILNYMIQLTDISMRDTWNLKRLKCRACAFTDKMFTELIASAPRLQLLDLSGCRGVTNITLKKAAAVTLNRTNNIILKIFVGGTAVNIEEFNEVSPLLHIVNVNFRKCFATSNFKLF